MNRNQYFVVSGFFLVLMFILMWLHTTFFLSMSTSLMTSTSNVNTYGIYYGVKWALISFMIYLCFPLFVLFQILAWLEKKDDDILRGWSQQLHLINLHIGNQFEKIIKLLKKRGQ